MAVTYDELREWVLALPGTREVFVDSWNHFTLRYGEKMFASGDPKLPTASVKASLQDQTELIASAPDTYQKAAYVGRYGWVTVTLANADAAELRRIVEDAWRATAPKKVIRAHDSAQG
jgi:hypothetical protein